MMYSFYTTYLSAFMTTVLYEPEIDTVEKLLRSDIKILAIKRQMELHLTLGNLPSAMEKHYVIEKSGDDDDVIEYRDAMDTTYGYMTPTDRWRYYSKQQELLLRPLFRFSDICTGRYFVTYPMKFDNHLEEPLKYCIMLCQQFGLIRAWTDRSFRDAIEMNIFEILKDDNSNNVEPLDISFFNIGWTLLLVGKLLGGLVLLLEIILNRLFKI